jgi:hypothetical protein
MGRILKSLGAERIRVFYKPLAENWIEDVVAA